MWNKISKIYVGTNQVRPIEAPTHTFDFQNDWALNWTAQSIYWTPTLTSWQWWTIGYWSGGFQSLITPPSSVYGWTLKSVKLRIYKGVTANYGSTVGTGIGGVSLNPSCMWEQAYYGSSPYSVANVHNGSDHFTQTTSVTWELVLEYILNDDGSLVLKVNSTEYNLWQFASLFRTQWTNQDLWIQLWRWNVADGNLYIRKVQIFTE